MDAANEVGIKEPPAEFQENVKDPLIDLDLTDSTELWLIQWPFEQDPGLDGQELSLNLHVDGALGKFEGSSGKSYDVMSYNTQDPHATVFLSGAPEPKIVGKISRRVSLVRYPDASELEELRNKKKNQGSSLTSLTNSSHDFDTQGPSRRSLKSAGTSSASMVTSRGRSSLSEAGKSSKSSKRKQSGEPTMSTDQSTRDSVRGHNERKSKK